ncbi:Rpn family recombination-promoting nuclease/putative transposase [Aerosakkonema sp. BLCC-F183]|uniref:Rpn family recombination-promoting nuclease/putative transposase n=1 Tax=Aerosakkonema sp. BLCC-F183 TaxID=3342834 RepID=UPI0035B9683B
MNTDNLCKYLAEEYPAEFVQWLLPSETSNIQVLKTELSLEPIRADSITLLQTPNLILHLEFQTLPASDPPLPLRMLDYWLRLYRKYRCNVEQVVIFLKSTTSEIAYTNEFTAPNTRHRYRVIRMWEEDPAPLLANSGLLPLATLARSESPQALLAQVAQQVANIEETPQRQNVAACIYVLAGLRFDKNLITQLFREEIMRESVIYQDILQRGEIAVIMRQLNRRIGLVTPEIQAKIQTLSIAQLEDLGEALLDFSQPADLTAWLESHQA